MRIMYNYHLDRGPLKDGALGEKKEHMITCPNYHMMYLMLITSRGATTIDFYNVD